MTLDSQDLTIDSVQMAGVAVEFHHEAGANKLTVARLPGSSERIRIAFSGKALETMQTGLFVGKVGGRPALSTQMEPESCRRLLPCFDRPDRKAVFRVHVTTASELVVISNMPSTRQRVGPDRTRWDFSPTPPMSTYLLYLGVGPFEELIDDQGPIPVVVAGPPGKRAQAERTARLARTFLRGYTEYFDVPYPLPKLHLIALTDFWAGMENWGAISGSEDMYLLDDSAAPRTLEFGERVIAHEIAHQWFGDLVTLRSWEDLWLNEAFATFAVPLAQELTHLRQDPWAEFVLGNVRGFRYDSLRCSHPVKPNTYDPAEIMAYADEITYFKGSRLIWMIQAFIGPDSFRDGITEYLRDHEFGNARSDDLWAALEEESRLPVTRVMRSWIERPGHPCITVRQVDADVELTQHRFTLVPGTDVDPPWPIPVTVTVDASREAIIFDSERITLPGRDARKLTIDPDRAGFFRVLWAPELRARVFAELPSASPEDRSGFALDAEAFVISGDYSLADYAALLDHLTPATDRLTAESVAQSLDILEPVLSDVPRFVEPARRFCAAQAKRLGERLSRGEPEGSEVAREWIFWMWARLDPEYSATLSGRFESLDQEPRALRQAILSSYARHGGPGSVPRLMELVRRAESELSIVAAFAFGETPHIAEVLAEIDRDLSSIPMVNLLGYLTPSLARNPASRPALWEWLSRNLPELDRRATGSGLMALSLGRMLPYVGIGRASEVRSYFEEHVFPAVGRERSGGWNSWRPIPASGPVRWPPVYIEPEEWVQVS